MRNNQTGEFELVVGNRQLLSGFFIIVLLFAVAFAMGYVVGQNSPRSSKLASEAAPVPTPVATPVPERPSSRSSGPGGSSAAPPAESAAVPAPESAAPTPQPAPEAAPSSPAAPPSLAAGSYWQAIAVPQADAEVIAGSLRDKGFPIVLTPGTRNLTRVLVGPYADKQTLAKAKTDLENAGFHPFLWK